MSVRSRSSADGAGAARHASKSTSGLEVTTTQGEQQMPEKAVKPARKRAASTKRAARARSIDPADIATRAYYIYLDEGSSDQLENWLRAERELTAA